MLHQNTILFLSDLQSNYGDLKAGLLSDEECERKVRELAVKFLGFDLYQIQKDEQKVEELQAEK